MLRWTHLKGTNYHYDGVQLQEMTEGIHVFMCRTGEDIYLLGTFWLNLWENNVFRQKTYRTSTQNLINAHVNTMDNLRGIKGQL